MGAKQSQVKGKTKCNVGEVGQVRGLEYIGSHPHAAQRQAVPAHMQWEPQASGLRFSNSPVVLSCTAAKGSHDVGPGFQRRDPQTGEDGL